LKKRTLGGSDEKGSSAEALGISNVALFANEQNRNHKKIKYARKVNTLDPIMFTALKKSVFKFYRPNDTYVAFNIDSLVDYLLSTGDFSDPETRIMFSDKDLSDIDEAAKRAGKILLSLSASPHKA